MNDDAGKSVMIHNTHRSILVWL